MSQYSEDGIGCLSDQQIFKKITTPYNLTIFKTPKGVLFLTLMWAKPSPIELFNLGMGHTWDTWVRR